MRFEAHHIADYQITFGALANSHTYLYNLAFHFPQKTYEPLTDKESPSRGAYSYHTGRTFYARRDIAAGEELFLNYGQAYLDGRRYLDHVPRYNDFELAGFILHQLIESNVNISTYGESIIHFLRKITRSQAGMYSTPPFSLKTYLWLRNPYPI